MKEVIEKSGLFEIDYVGRPRERNGIKRIVLGLLGCNLGLITGIAQSVR